MLANTIAKVKQWLQENNKDLLVAGIIFLVGLASFGLGRLSVLVSRKEPIMIEQPEGQEVNASAEPQKTAEKDLAGVVLSRGKYVASRNGKVYHLPWCAGAQRIKEENKIWFQTKEEAESRGYNPAGNCEGL